MKDLLLIVFCVFFIFCLSVGENNPLCDVSAGLRVEGDGYHRLLNLTVSISGGPSVKQLHDVCELAVYQELPSGVYVDPEQLNEASHSYKSINAFYFDNKVDVEARKEVSNPINVLIYYNKSKDTAISEHPMVGSDFVQYSFLLPIHLRYHAPRYRGGYQYTIIPHFSILGRCPSSLSDKLNHFVSKIMSTDCSEHTLHHFPCDISLVGKTDTILCDDWKSISFSSEKEPAKAHADINNSKIRIEQDELLLTVPVGDLDDLQFVRIVTLSITNTAAVYVVYCIYITVWKR